MAYGCASPKGGQVNRTAQYFTHSQVRIATACPPVPLAAGNDIGN